MKTDLELIELVAKVMQSMGEPSFTNYTVCENCLRLELGSQRGAVTSYWNPLTDDGDALRLAVKLRLEIVPVQNGVIDVCLPSADPFVCACEGGTDPYAATRRAIVRAAARIGETK